jgi:hypothetical protein
MQLPAKETVIGSPPAARCLGPAVKHVWAWHRTILGTFVLAIILAPSSATGSAARFPALDPPDFLI